MKKFMSLLLVAVMAVGLVACGQKQNQKQIEGSLSEVMAQVYKNSGLAFANEVTLMESELTADNVEAYLGTKDVEFTEGLVSEPMMNSIPHLMVLLRVKDGADVNAIVKTIQEKANPQRWICVWVDPSDVKVSNVGNLVLLVMAEDSEKYVEAFQNLAK
jgi:hypothetical protein